MAKFLTWYLAITGALSLVVLAMPWLVILGAFALILPGLILGLAPTAFLWGALFTAFWVPLRALMGEWPATIIAGALAGAVVIAIPTLLNAPFHAQAAAERSGDKIPPSRIAFSGTIEVTVPYRAWINAEKNGLACDLVCHAILYTPGVDAVILREGPGRPKPVAPVQLRLEKRSGGCDSKGTANATTESWGDWNERPGLLQSWLIRQAGGECLVREPVSRQPDFTVGFEIRDSNFRGDWSLKPPPVSVRRLTIARVSGGKAEMLLRRSFAWGRPLIVPLMAVPEGGLNDFRFKWGRTSGASYKGEGHFEAITLLAAQTNVALAPDAKLLGDAARTQIMAALDDPARPEGDAGFALARALFDDIEKNGPRDGDRALLARTVGDPRVTDLNMMWNATRKFDKDGGLPELRTPIIHRLLTVSTDRDSKGESTLGTWLDQLPEGTFATLTPDEEALLADPVRRRWAVGLIRRLADRGAAAVPLIIPMLDDNDTREAARTALCLLGPAAAHALPEVEAKLLRPYYNRDWQITLARMGKPIESFRAEPGSSWDDARTQQGLRDRLARFDPKRDCR